MRVYSSNGIIIEDNGLRIGLDTNKGDLNFISHAHSDHLFSSRKPVLASSETVSLALARRKRVGNLVSRDDFRMIDSGHVLGSRALLYHGSRDVLFTGDFCTRSRFFLKGFAPVKADVLVMETTFGRPEYVFPSFKKTIVQVKEGVERLLGAGKNVLLKGYSLGKAQQLSFLARGLDNVFVDEGVKRINDVYRGHGVNLKDFPVFTGDEKNFVLISSKNFVPRAVSMSFTGWNASRPVSSEDFILSDHSDFFELLRVVKKVCPDKVFTYHGFSDDFARFLRLEGFDASPIKDKQHSLNNFL